MLSIKRIGWGLFITIVVDVILIIFMPQVLSRGAVDGVLDLIYGQNETNFFILFLVGLLIIIVVSLIAVIINMMVSRKEDSISIVNEMGELKISLRAVEGFVKRLCRETPEVSDASVRVAQGKKGLDITGKITLSSVVNVPDIAKRIQLKVREEVQHVLGVTNVKRINFHVKKLHYKKRKVDDSADESKTIIQQEES